MRRINGSMETRFVASTRSQSCCTRSNLALCNTRRDSSATSSQATADPAMTRLYHMRVLSSPCASADRGRQAAQDEPSSTARSGGHEGSQLLRPWKSARQEITRGYCWLIGTWTTWHFSPLLQRPRYVPLPRPCSGLAPARWPARLLYHTLYTIGSEVSHAPA